MEHLHLPPRTDTTEGMPLLQVPTVVWCCAVLRCVIYSYLYNYTTNTDVRCTYSYRVPVGALLYSSALLRLRITYTYCLHRIGSAFFSLLLYLYLPLHQPQLSALT